MPHLKPSEVKEQQAARSMKRFDHRTVVVTGGARGMGASHARGFVAEGANVVIADVLEQEGWTLASELGDHTIFSRLDVHYTIGFDVRSPTQVPDSEHLAIIEMRGERIFKMRNFRNLHDAQL